jgi:hypothetical protein
MDTVERGTPAEDIKFVNRFPSQERAEQTAKPKNVIEMSVCKQYICEVFKSRTRLQDLSLCAFAAIHQKTIFIVFDDVCGKPALCRWCGCGSAKKKYFEQWSVLTLKKFCRGLFCFPLIRGKVMP